MLAAAKGRSGGGAAGGENQGGGGEGGACVLYQEEGGIATLTLNRPKVCSAVVFYIAPPANSSFVGFVLNTRRLCSLGP